MDKRWKRSLALLMTVVMLLGLLSTAAFAAEEENEGLMPTEEPQSEESIPVEAAPAAGSVRAGEPVTDWKELQSKIDEGGSIAVSLPAELTSDDTITIPAGTDVTISAAEDGTTLTIGSADAFQVSGSLTLEGTITVAADEDELEAGFLSIEAGGTANLNGAVYVGEDIISSESLIVCSGTLTMEEGGAVSGYTTNDMSEQPAAIVVSGENAAFTMTGGEISDNIQTGGANSIKGGAVQILEGAQFKMNGGKITGNNVYSDDKKSSIVVKGGGVYVDGSTMTMTDGEISSNMAFQGGGVYLTGGAQFTMTGGEIAGNKYANRSKDTPAGGGIYVGSGCALTVESTDKENPATISDNKTADTGNYVQARGGGIFATGAEITLTDAVVSGNTSAIGSGIAGGGIYVEDGSTLTVTDCEISENSGYYSLDNMKYESGGGGIVVDDDSSLNMRGTTVSGNTALYGAGVYLDGTTSVTITDCVISENESLLDINNANWYYNSCAAGGIFYNSSSGELNIIDTTFQGNTAMEFGGAMVIVSGTADIQNCDFIGNESPQGGGIYSLGKTSLTNCTLSGNDGSGAGGAFSIDSGTTTLTGCTVQENTSNGEQGWGGGAYVAGTLILDDTNFVENAATNRGVGGGVYLASGGTLEIKNGSSVSSNTATEAGGIANAGGSVTFSDGMIVNNEALMAGGVENLGTFTMSGGAITGNQATGTSDKNGEDGQGVGGGVANITGTFTMTGGEIHSNTANTGANDFYNYAEEDESGGDIDIDIDDGWDGNHGMEIESLVAGPRAGDSYGTFTLLTAETFGYGGWFEDEPGNRYEDADTPVEYQVTENDITEQYLTLGEPMETVTIEIQDMTAYTGGDSMSDKSFPEVRYQFTASDPSVDVEKINFKIGEQEYSLGNNLDNGPVQKVSDGVYVIPATTDTGVLRLPVEYTHVDNPEGGEATDDSVAGEYEVSLSDEILTALEKGYITASYEGAVMNVAFVPGTLTVRNVSDPKEVLDDVGTVAKEIVTAESAADTSDGMAVAVISADAAFYTNGKEELGLLGNGTEDAQISLMFDDLIAREDIIEAEGADTTKLLVDYAEKKGYTLTDGQYEFKYLDLVSENDGNAWVSTDKDITIFWPYPDEATSNPEKYTFTLIHFKGLHREYDVDTEDALNELIAASQLEEIQGERTDKGVKFTLDGNINSGSFSPFALVWEENTTPAQNYTVTFRPGDHGTLSGTTSYTVAAGSEFGTSGRTVPAVHENSNYDFTVWKDQNGNTYTSSQIQSLPITGNMTFTAQYKRESSGGGNQSGGGGGGGTGHYILRYESNGGTEYDDERYAKYTLVDLDKVPTREGYTFTGWYADEELTERITEIRMTSNKTVYAGWEATGVPDLLNGDDHFAYVIGYADGTVRPLDNISRAEVATIIFRLLDPEVRDEYLTTTNTFEDVNEGMWCNTAISTLARLGIVYGRTSTFFDPDASITRAEFAAICARFDNSGIEADSSFTDISGHWAEDEIELAATLGWIRGYTDGTFRPNNLITRAEAMTMINRMLQRLPEDEDDLLPEMNVWPDNQPDDWYYLAVQEATNSHDFNRKSDGVHEHWTELTADPDWKQYE